MKPLLPSHAHDPEYLDEPLRLLLLTLSLFPKTRTQIQPLDLNLALFVSLFVPLSVSQTVPISLLFLTLPQILSLLLSLPPPLPLRLQPLFLKTLTQTLIQAQT